MSKFLRQILRERKQQFSLEFFDIMGRICSRVRKKTTPVAVGDGEILESDGRPAVPSSRRRFLLSLKDTLRRDKLPLRRRPEDVWISDRAVLWWRAWPRFPALCTKKYRKFYKLNQSINRSHEQSFNQSNEQSTNQSIHRSISGSVSQISCRMKARK